MEPNICWGYYSLNCDEDWDRATNKDIRDTTY